MTPEERSLLERTHELAQENNEILRSIRRSNRISMAFRIGYWVVIIGLAVGAFYFIQPYLQMVWGLFDQIGGGKGIGGTLNSAQSAADSLFELLK